MVFSSHTFLHFFYNTVLQNWLIITFFAKSMKLILSILLFLITSFYVLPISEICKNNTAICLSDVDDEIEENIKKEKSKELFSFTTLYSVPKSICNHTYTPTHFKVLLLLHIVETPPPNCI